MLADQLPILRERYRVLRGLWREPPADDAVDWDAYGVHDPDAGRCVNQHYALSHLMLAAGLLHELTGQATYGLDAATMASLLARHHDAGYAGYDTDTIHWDFNNFAWLACACLPRATAVRTLAADPARRGLGRENGTWAGNWLTMRRVNGALRRRLGLRNRNPRRWAEPLLWRRLFRADGGIDEFPGRSRPLQYHAYVVALMLHQACATGGISPVDERRVREGLSYLLSHFDAAGNANWRGRGQYQLFFEGCAIHALSVASAWYGEQAGSHCRDALALLLAKHWPVRPDGLLALVATDPLTERTGSHYDYHHVSVYNAFDLAWRLLALHDAERVRAAEPPRGPAPAVRTGVFPASGLWLGRHDGWLAAACAGEPMYLSDVGVTFCHLAGPRGTLFTAPGGPHPSRYGRDHGSDSLRANVFGPLWVVDGDGGLPHFHRGTLAGDADAVRLRVAAGRHFVERTLGLEGPLLRVSDRWDFPVDARLRHGFHWALPTDLEPEPCGPGRYRLGRAGELPLAILAFAEAPVRPLQRAAPIRGPGGVVRPWFTEAEPGPGSVSFTLELQP
jgi:hypothetical protein